MLRFFVTSHRDADEIDVSKMRDDVRCLHADAMFLDGCVLVSENVSLSGVFLSYDHAHSCGAHDGEISHEVALFDPSTMFATQAGACVSMILQS